MKRPDTVDPSAEWSEEDNEWVLGERDDAGELHGEVHYWRPDGTLVSIAHLHHGKWHGRCTRFHPNGEPSQIDHMDMGVLHGLRTWIGCDEPTPEVMHTPGMSTDIWRAEVVYDRGRPTKFRWYLRDATEVEVDGTPVAVRPEGVPEGAIFNKKSDCWIAGTWDATGKRDGELRVYRADGTLLSIENYTADVPDGLHEVFFEGGTLSMRRTMSNGAIAGRVEFYFRNGQLAREGTMRDSQWDGALTDYDRSGAVIGSSTTEPPAPPAQLPEMTEFDVETLDRLDADDDVTSLSPQGLAKLTAIAWGGTAGRDADRARSARALARRHEAFASEVLCALGLDTAPRLMTSTRLGRLLAAGETFDAIDAVALRRFLIAEGGVAQMAALLDGGTDGLEYLNAQTKRGRLSLENLGLTELPVVLRYAADVTSLALSRNALTEIPTWIADLAFLQRLELSKNKLFDLPTALARLRQLSSLSLSDNVCAAVPDALLQLEEMTSLGLGSNQIEHIPDAFADLPRLKTLWLNDNPLETLPASFSKLPLTFLHLGNAPWSRPPDCLWELTKLETLWLSSRALEHLPASIANLTTLKELMIWHSNLSELPDVLFEMTHLEELRVGGNPLPEGTIDALKEALPNCKVY